MRPERGKPSQCGVRIRQEGSANLWEEKALALFACSQKSNSCRPAVFAELVLPLRGEGA